MVSKPRYHTFSMRIIITIQIISLLIQPSSSALPRTPNLPSMDLLLNRIQMPRSFLGRILSFRPGNSNAVYIQSLQEQIVQMERQLRKSEMEAVQLRTLLRSQTSSNRRSAAGNIRDQFKIEEDMQKIIDEMTKQIAELNKTKAEMEGILKLEQERAATAEELLREEQSISQKLIKNSRIEMEEMKGSILKKASSQMKEMEKTHLAKFEMELEDVKIESKKALEKEKARSNIALEKERKGLEEEKRKGKEAVEKERVKMRKLVKALAEKEKRDLVTVARKNVTNKDQHKRKENKRAGLISSSESSSKRARKAQVRGKTKPS